jgi:hypothetical protein
VRPESKASDGFDPSLSAILSSSYIDGGTLRGYEQKVEMIKFAL